MNHLNLCPTSVRLKYLDKKMQEFVKVFVSQKGNTIDSLTIKVHAAVDKLQS